MATAQTVVDNALSYLGVQTELVPATPKLVSDTFDELIEMLNQWATISLDLGVTIPTNISDELGNPDGTTIAISSALAMEAQALAKVDVKPRLMSKFKRSYSRLKAAFGLRPEQSFPSSMPYGQGNNLGPRTARYFPEPASVGSSNNTGLGS